MPRPEKTVMIVDDNPANMKLTAFLLESEGYSVVTATSGEEAIQKLTATLPRVILMDLQMPRMTGYELTRRLKADPQTRGVKILAITAYAMTGDEERARDAGCDGYLTKPIDLEEVLTTLAAVLAETAA